MNTTTTTTTTASAIAADRAFIHFARQYVEQAIYEVAEDRTRAEAIVGVTAALREIQAEEPSGELMANLQELEQAAGPQKVIAFETVGIDRCFRDPKHPKCNDPSTPPTRIINPVLSQAEDVIDHIEQAAQNIDLVYDFRQPRESIANRLALMKIMLFRFAHMANDAQNLLVEVGHVAGDDCRGSDCLSGEYKAHVDELCAVPAFELQGLINLVDAGRPGRPRVPPSQSLAYRIAKRAASEPRRNYWTRQTARRLGVQQLD